MTCAEEREAQCDRTVKTDEQIACALVDCALWAETDIDGEQEGSRLDERFSGSDLSPGAAAFLAWGAVRFLEKAEAAGLGLIVYDNPENAGHDLWLSTQGHGAGFWDGDWGDVGDKLDALAKEALREIDLYPGDDGKVYILGVQE